MPSPPLRVSDRTWSRRPPADAAKRLSHRRMCACVRRGVAVDLVAEGAGTDKEMMVEHWVQRMLRGPPFFPINFYLL